MSERVGRRPNYMWELLNIVPLRTQPLTSEELRQQIERDGALSELLRKGVSEVLPETEN